MTTRQRIEAIKELVRGMTYEELEEVGSYIWDRWEETPEYAQEIRIALAGKGLPIKLHYPPITR